MPLTSQRLNSKALKFTTNYPSKDMDDNQEQSRSTLLLRRTGSKSTSKKLRLTQSLSVNLESFRFSRNGLDKCHSLVPVNDNNKAETNSVNIGSDLEKDFVLEELTPQQIRRIRYIKSCPITDLKFTFEEECMKFPCVYGELKMKFQFINERDEFRITVLKGCNIASQNTGTLGVYTKVWLMPGKLQAQSGTDKHDTHEPVFYETFVFKSKLTDLLNRDLKIKLYNKPGIFSLAKPLGECLVHLYSYDLTSSTVLWQSLKRCKDQQDDMDEFDFTPLERNSKLKKKGWGKWLCCSARARGDDLEDTMC